MFLAEKSNRSGWINAQVCNRLEFRILVIVIYLLFVICYLEF